MSRAEKLLKRFLAKPNDFTFEELRRLLGSLGYKEHKAGKTSGSRATFIQAGTLHIIKLHRPHPSPCLKRYQLDYIEETLRDKGVIE